jgi:hypothetical protein
MNTQQISQKITQFDNTKYQLSIAESNQAVAALGRACRDGGIIWSFRVFWHIFLKSGK